MKWGSEDIAKCLASYARQTCLWDFNDANFKNKLKRSAALKHILKEMNVDGMSVDDLKNKIHSIRNTYTNELRKIEHSKKSSSDNDQIYKPKIPWFSIADSFLRKIVSKRKSRLNLMSTDTSFEQQEPQSSRSPEKRLRIQEVPVNQHKKHVDICIPGPVSDTGDTSHTIDFHHQQEQQQFSDLVHIETDPVESGDSAGFTQETGTTFVPSADDQQQYCLKWKFHQDNQQDMFSKLLQRESFCDVTIACEERTLRAHKLLLSACSSYFERILYLYEDKNPIIILKDVRYDDMSALLQFMYKGEINIEQSQLSSLLETAELLKVKGLSDICGEARHVDDSNHTSDVKAEEQPGDNSTHEPPRTVPQRRRTISVSEENFQRPLKIFRRSMNIESDQNAASPSTPTSSPVRSSAQLEGLIRLPEFLKNHGSYYDFWRKPWVVKALKAVSDREMTLRNCADLLGVGYNVLYSRYRHVHGCVKEISSDSSGASYTLRLVRTNTDEDQEGKIVLRRDQLSPAAAALSATNRNEVPASTSTTQNVTEPIVNVKVEPCSSFESEMVEDLDLGQMC